MGAANLDFSLPVNSITGPESTKQLSDARSVPSNDLIMMKSSAADSDPSDASASSLPIPDSSVLPFSLKTVSNCTNESVLSDVVNSNSNQTVNTVQSASSMNITTETTEEVTVITDAPSEPSMSVEATEISSYLIDHVSIESVLESNSVQAVDVNVESMAENTAENVEAVENVVLKTGNRSTKQTGLIKEHSGSTKFPSKRSVEAKPDQNTPPSTDVSNDGKSSKQSLKKKLRVVYDSSEEEVPRVKSVVVALKLKKLQNHLPCLMKYTSQKEIIQMTKQS